MYVMNHMFTIFPSYADEVINQSERRKSGEEGSDG